MALFKSTEEIKAYLPKINVNTGFKLLKPYIQEAASEFLIPLLGEDFYNSLSTKYLAGTLDNNEKTLLPYVQRCLAYYMAYLSVDELLTSIGAEGIQQTRAENSEPAPQWKVDRIRRRYIMAADKHAEELLKYLETNATASIYNEWFSDATANTKNEGYIVNNTRTTSKHVDINESRRIFLRMKKRIVDIESSEAKRLLGQAQYDEIVTQIKTGSLSVNNKKITDLLEPIIAKRALFETIPFLRLMIDERGISILSSSDGAVTKAAASRDEVKTIMHHLKEGSTGWESDEATLHEFITNNIETYPLIKGSTAYTSRPETGSVHTHDNKSTNKYFAV